MTSLLAGLLLVVGGSLLAARREVVHAATELRAARTALIQRDHNAAVDSLDRAARDFGQARAGARRLPLQILRPIPLLGSPAKAVDAVARAGSAAVEAGRLVLDVSESFPTPDGADVSAPSLAPVHLATLRAGAGLAGADQRLAAAVTLLGGPASAALPQVSKPAREVRAELVRSRRDLGRAGSGMAVLGDLTGPDADVRLLLLAQDSLELRPTGGYIGSFGVVDFQAGAARLERYEASDVLPPAEPALEPPAVLADALPGSWGLSNANWWPDFPTTAQVARELFRRQGGGEIDGVVALTEQAIGRLVGAVGPVTVPGYDPPVVEEGFSQRVLYEVEQKRPIVGPRKQFMTELARVLFDRIFEVPTDRTAPVADAISRSVGAGDIQVWFADHKLEQRIAGAVVAGELPQDPGGDFLMLVDANLVASKANAGLVKDVEYRVRRRSDGRKAARLTVTVRNEAGASEVNPIYIGYLRVYAPRGSKLIPGEDGQRAEGAAADGPYEVFGQGLAVLPRGQQVVTFDYLLPATVDDGRGYRLTWVRQVGTPGDSLRATVGTTTADMVAGQRTLQLDEGVDGGGALGWLRGRWLVRALGF